MNLFFSYLFLFTGLWLASKGYHSYALLCYLPAVVVFVYRLPGSIRSIKEELKKNKRSDK